MTPAAQEAVGLAFRQHAAELTAQLARRLGAHRLDLAEDAVQQALVQALRTWSIHPPPADPRAWLTRVAHNAAIDLLRREASGKHEPWSGAHEELASLPGADPRFADEVEDEVLRLLFACSHPLLSEELRLALTLKVACGFSVAEIAHAFFVEEPAIAQRIVRAKRILREREIPLEVPAAAELTGRVGSVLTVVYLLFNAGYAPGLGALALRQDLCREALRLVELLASHASTRSHEVHALAALLFLIAARLPTRVELSGELVVLASQDRRRWDGACLSRGFGHLSRSMGKARTRYHLEAAIAAAHALAPSVEATDWARIVSHYDALLELAPSPLVELNRAVALGEAGRQAEAFAAIDRVVASGGWLARTSAPLVARAHLLERAGRFGEAAVLFTEGATLAAIPAQRELFVRRAAACREEARSGGS